MPLSVSDIIHNRCIKEIRGLFYCYLSLTCDASAWFIALTIFDRIDRLACGLGRFSIKYSFYLSPKSRMLLGTTPLSSLACLKPPRHKRRCLKIYRYISIHHSEQNMLSFQSTNPPPTPTRVFGFLLGGMLYVPQRREMTCGRWKKIKDEDRCRW